jgi:NAD(P)-dependent dehydrogenase (short-subunit alcohol dehydrogenase family)
MSVTAPLEFQDRVAVVTGAGRGIGRAHAMLLAARRATVVVNDLGTTMTGAGRDPSLAAQVAEEITAAGGNAAANSSDVSTTEGAQELIDQTFDTFGRVDIVVNNAGVFAVDEFPAMELADMRRLWEIHIGGGFNVTRAAWPHMAAAHYGRVVFTTSTSALGAADTLAYTTAKAGVWGLGRALAQVGLPLGIAVNLVSPMAMTRMMSAGHGRSETPPDVPERAPALVAPLVAVLCHESCPVSGETFVAGMRRHSWLYMSETEGYVHPDLDGLTPEVVRDHWDEIVDSVSGEVVSNTTSWIERNSRIIAAAPVVSGQEGGA